MQASSVKIAWKVMLAESILMIVAGLLMASITKIMFASAFNGFTTQSWSNFVASNPKPAELFIMMERMTGIMILITGLLVALISWKSYSKAEKWSWYTLFITGVIGWASSLTSYIIIGDSTGKIVSIIGSVLFVIAIVLPAKAILGKKSA